MSSGSEFDLSLPTANHRLVPAHRGHPGLLDQLFVRAAQGPLWPIHSDDEQNPLLISQCETVMHFWTTVPNRYSTLHCHIVSYILVLSVIILTNFSVFLVLSSISNPPYGICSFTTIASFGSSSYRSILFPDTVTLLVSPANLVLLLPLLLPRPPSSGSPPWPPSPSPSC